MGKKMVIFFLLQVCLFVIPVGSMAEEERPVGTMAQEERLVLEDGTQELQKIPVSSADAYVNADERYQKIREKSRLQIDDLLAQIRSPENRGREGELQKQIEEIKRNAVIQRLSFMRADAEKRGQSDLAGELGQEITRLEAGAVIRTRRVGKEPVQQPGEQLKEGGES